MEEMINLIRSLINNESKVIKKGLYESKANLDVSIFSVLYVWAQLRSKDPKTKVGAAVYEPTTGALHMGYNGFNHGIPDSIEVWDNRDNETSHNKYTHVVHAEVNAVMKALRAGFNPAGAVLYCTHWPCHRCLKDSIIPAGIKSIKYLTDYPPDAESLELLRHLDIKLTKVALDFSEKLLD